MRFPRLIGIMLDINWLCGNWKVLEGVKFVRFNFRPHYLLFELFNPDLPNSAE